MQNFPSNHFTLRTRLLHFSTNCHSHYLKVSRSFPLRLPPVEECIRADAKL